MSYDPECEKLADYFLAAYGTDVPTGPKQVLAQHIQDAVEIWLRGYEADLERDEWDKMSIENSRP
jgi:hypothetical protein